MFFREYVGNETYIFRRTLRLGVAALSVVFRLSLLCINSYAHSLFGMFFWRACTVLVQQQHTKMQKKNNPIHERRRLGYACDCYKIRK